MSHIIAATRSLGSGVSARRFDSFLGNNNGDAIKAC
jgi:hypothetical protein